jgi:predicted peptidase
MSFHLHTSDNPHIPYSCYRYVPDGIDLDAKPPVVVFMHGVGERGSDPSAMLSSGLSHVIDEVVRPPAVMLFPQCRDVYRAYYGDMEKLVFAAIDDAVRDFNVDTTRISLLGYSMGSTSSLWLTARHPNRFAAIGAIAVGINWEEPDLPPLLPEDKAQQDLFYNMYMTPPEHQGPFIAQAVQHVPIWFIHGTADEPCPISEPRLLDSELRKLGADVRLTEYEGVGHDSLIRGVQEPGLFSWLLAHRSRASRLI